MEIRETTLREANAFVERLHRHHGRAVGHKWSLAAYKDGRLCAVAIVGRPSGRYLDDGNTLEVTRLCSDGTRNACSALYAACARRAKREGYGGTIKGGRSIYFEAKHTDDDRIEQRRLTAEQADDLEAHHKLGAITFVLVSFGLRAFYRVPWPVWRDMAETYGRKYIRQEELKPYEVPAVAGYIKLLDGLPPEAITIGRIGENELNRIRQVLDDSPGILLPGEGAAL